MRFPDYLNISSENGIEKNEAIIKQALKEHPEDKEVLKAVLAFKYFSSPPNHNKSIKLFNELIAESSNAEILQDAYYMSAALYYDVKKDIDEGIKRYKKYLEYEPDNEDIVAFLAEYYIDTVKDYEQAAHYASMFAAIEEYEYEEWRFRGLIFHAQKEYNKAIVCFNKAALMVPEDAKDSHPTYLIGVCYAEKKNYDKAIEIFNRALTIEPENALAYKAIGLCYQYKGDYYRSMDNYLKALQINPNMPLVYNDIASLSLEHDNDFKKAEAYLNRALEEAEKTGKSNMHLIYRNLYMIHKEMHNDDKAAYYQSKMLKSLGFDFSDINFLSGEDNVEDDE